MARPQLGDPFQVEGTPEVLNIDVLEWGASRSPESPMRPEFYVARTSQGDRYVLVPLEEPVLDVRWRGIALRKR